MNSRKWAVGAQARIVVLMLKMPTSHKGQRSRSGLLSPRLKVRVLTAIALQSGCAVLRGGASLLWAMDWATRTEIGTKNPVSTYCARNGRKSSAAERRERNRRIAPERTDGLHRVSPRDQRAPGSSLAQDAWQLRPRRRTGAPIEPDGRPSAGGRGQSSPTPAPPPSRRYALTPFMPKADAPVIPAGAPAPPSQLVTTASRLSALHSSHRWRC